MLRCSISKIGTDADFSPPTPLPNWSAPSSLLLWVIAIAPAIDCPQSSPRYPLRVKVRSCHFSFTALQHPSISLRAKPNIFMIKYTIGFPVPLSGLISYWFPSYLLSSSYKALLPIYFSSLFLQDTNLLINPQIKFCCHLCGSVGWLQLDILAQGFMYGCSPLSACSEVIWKLNELGVQDISLHDWQLMLGIVDQKWSMWTMETTWFPCGLSLCLGLLKTWQLRESAFWESASQGQVLRRKELEVSRPTKSHTWHSDTWDISFWLKQPQSLAGFKDMGK